MTETRKRPKDDNRIVVSADGRLCVSGAARSNLVAALQRMRAMPEEVTALLGEFQATAAALESTLASPAALEVSTYYELVASFEESMARTMQMLLDMAPADEESPNILATLQLAQARAECFRYFAKFPGDEANARAHLLGLSGVRSALQASLMTPERTVLQEEGAALARTLRAMVDRFGPVDPGLAQSASELATQLESAPQMSLWAFFAQQSDVWQALCALYMRSVFIHRELPVDLRPPGSPPDAEDEMHARGVGYAMAAAACGLLAGFFEDGPAAGQDAPRLILN